MSSDSPSLCAHSGSFRSLGAERAHHGARDLSGPCRLHPGGSQLIVAYRNADARELNDSVRAARRAVGELAQPAVAIGGREYAAGGRIVFLRNDHQSLEVANVDHRAAGAGVKNGTLGTVERAVPDRLRVRLDDGRAVAFDPRQYQDVAHGYAVTIHKSQGATVDRTYALADPMMDRHAAYVAMTRHRESVHLYADRETFGDRSQLDRALSRDSRKDLARDYGASELERAAGRVVQWQEREQALAGQQNQLYAGRLTLNRAEVAAQDLAESRPDVERAAARVYARPDDAVRLMLADTRTAAECLARGQSHAYGELLGRVRPCAAPTPSASAPSGPCRSCAPRSSAISSSRTPGTMRSRQPAASAPPWADPGAAGPRRRHSVQHVRAATGPAEKAFGHVAERLGRAAVNTAISLLPKPLQVPLRTAMYAIRRVLDLGRDLGLGR